MPLENTPRLAARRDAANSGSHMHSETRLCVTSSRGATQLVAGRRRGGQSIRAGSSRRTPEKRGGNQNGAGKHLTLDGSPSHANSGKHMQPQSRPFATASR